MVASLSKKRPCNPQEQMDVHSMLMHWSDRIKNHKTLRRSGQKIKKSATLRINEATQ